jgi:hypothetical protein
MTDKMRALEKGLFDTINKILYPHAGARDEAVERLNRLAGRDENGPFAPQPPEEEK